MASRTGWPSLAGAMLFLLGAAASMAAILGKYAAALLIAGLAAAVIARLTINRVPPSPAEAEAKPRERGLALAPIIDEVPAPLLLLDQMAKLRALNRAARRLFRTDDLIIDPSPRLLEAILSKGSLKIVRLGHGEAVRGYTVSLAEVASESLNGTLIALLDVEAELRSAEAKALKQLMQVLSHEIMGALAPIASLSATAVEILDDPNPDLHEVRDAIKTVAERARALEHFTTAYRQLARLPEPVLEPIDLGDLLDSTAKLFRARFETLGVEIETRAWPCIAIEGDSDQLSSAIWAILQNAAEAALEARMEPARARVSVAAELFDHEVNVYFSDSGRGVDRLISDSLFDPFFTTKKGGSGVGLSLARQIARAHGGDVRFCGNQPPDGATFQLELPRHSKLRV